MDKKAALELRKRLEARYVGAWPTIRGARVAKDAVLDEPVKIDARTIPAGTEVRFHPPQRKKPYSAVIFYEEDNKYTTIMSDGRVSSGTVGGGGKGRAVPRPRRV